MIERSVTQHLLSGLLHQDNHYGNWAFDYQGHIKLIDFGFSIFLPQETVSNMSFNLKQQLLMFACTYLFRIPIELTGLYEVDRKQMLATQVVALCEQKRLTLEQWNCFIEKARIFDVNDHLGDEPSCLDERGKPHRFNGRYLEADRHHLPRPTVSDLNIIFEFQKTVHETYANSTLGVDF